MHNKTALLLNYSLLAINPNKILFRCELLTSFSFLAVYAVYSKHTIATCNAFLCAKHILIAGMNFNVGI